MLARLYVMPISSRGCTRFWSASQASRASRCPSGRCSRPTRSCGRGWKEAERWGDQVLQPVPRRLVRHLLLVNDGARQWMGTEILHVPAPRALGVLFMPAIRQLERKSRADDARVRDDIARLPQLLDHVDELIADGTIGAAEPNAADFQILASVGVLRAFADLGHEVRGRPCEAAARRVYPDWPAIPSGLPAG
jgi:glutathione S-transferase